MLISSVPSLFTLFDIMNESPLDLVLDGAAVYTPGGLKTVDIGVRGGRTVALGDLKARSAHQRMDLEGLHVLPGVIDTQVHFREPGAEHKEDLESGTRAAAAGGVTAVFEMPNTHPLTTTAEALGDKLDRAKGRAWTDYAFFMGGTAENAHELGHLERMPGCCGVKIFMGASTGNLLVADDPGIASVLANGTRRVAVHAEDEPRLKERFHLVADGADPAMHPHWRDVEVALTATRRVVALAEQAKRRVHVLHITTAEEMAFLAQHKHLVTVEATPQHLTLSAPDCYQRLGTLAQMNPPIRDEHHRLALWQAVERGVVDVIGSDHAPHTLEEKAKPYPSSPSGMTGVQTLLPLLLNHMHEGRLSLTRLVDLTSAGAQRLYNIAGKGRIALGYDADFSIVDLNATRRITNDWIESKAGWTPYDGMQVKGWPMATIVRGHVVMREGELVGRPIGQRVEFTDCYSGDLTS